MYDCKYLTTFFCISLSQVGKKPTEIHSLQKKIYIIMHIENVLLLQQNHGAISIHS